MWEWGGGHDGVGIGGHDPGDQAASGSVAGNDSPGTTVEGQERLRAVVESQACLLLAGAVAREAVFREDRPDVLVEADRFVGRRGAAGEDERTGSKEERQGGPHLEAREGAEQGTTHEQDSWGGDSPLIRVPIPASQPGPRPVGSIGAAALREGAPMTPPTVMAGKLTRF